MAAASARGIPVINTPGANARSVAEGALTFALVLLKEVFHWDRQVRAGNWGARYELITRDLEDTVLGIVGFGNIGRTLASLALPLGLKVVASDPFVSAADARAAGGWPAAAGGAAGAGGRGKPARHPDPGDRGADRRHLPRLDETGRGAHQPGPRRPDRRPRHPAPGAGVRAPARRGPGHLRAGAARPGTTRSSATNAASAPRTCSASPRARCSASTCRWRRTWRRCWRAGARATASTRRRSPAWPRPERLEPVGFARQRHNRQGSQERRRRRRTWGATVPAGVPGPET